MKYRSDDHFVYLSDTPFSKKDDIQNLLNGQWVKSGYRFPKNVFAMRELGKYFPELVKNKDFVAEGKEQAEKIKHLEWLKTNIPPMFDQQLRPYQNADVHFLSQRGSALVLNEPRTGKTPTVIKTLSALQPKSSLIVAPSSLTFNWSKEFEKWASGEFHVTVYSGTPKQREKLLKTHRAASGQKVLIVSKDTLKLDKELQDMAFTVMVVDEAHFLRNYKTAQSKAVFKVNAKIKYALTGTPAIKHDVDVYGLLHFINPKAFPSYWQFAARYWEIDEDMWGKSVGKVKGYREKELKGFMESISVQRKRKEVMQWLPDQQHQTIHVKMGKKQLKLYEQMLEEFMAVDDEVEVDTVNILSQLMRLRQLCLEPKLLGFDVQGAKTDALLEFAENNTDPFIVMTTFSSYFPLVKPMLEKLGKKVGIIDGKVSQKEKFKTAEEFQKGNYDILLCNIIAAGTGFTLDRADTIVFLDKDFNPANNEQAQDRIVPTTKERYHNINIISLVAAGSIDERVHDILRNKEDLTKLINKRDIKELLK